MKIRLYTSIGFFITEVEIEMGFDLPDVVFWDNKAFTRKTQNIYYQCSFYIVPSDRPMTNDQ